jgi:pimeloyl-ACP methyl ester carboxylesterase
LAEEILQSVDDKRVTLRIYDGCGHGAFRDEPAVVFEDIRAFIAGLWA